MSINLSQNQEYQKLNNFGAGNFGTPEGTAQADMLKSMDLPSTPDEFVKFVPYVAGAFGVSKALEKLATKINVLNPFKNKNVNIEQSFQNSAIGRLSRKIDSALLPIIQKFSPQINTTKGAVQKYTPNFIKNIVEKIKIGVEPKFSMAKYQYAGSTQASANYFMNDILKKLPAEKLTKLGVDDIIQLFDTKKIKPTFAVEQIAKRLGHLPAKEWQNISISGGKSLSSLFSLRKINLVDELNKTRSFLATNAKTPVTKVLQKGIMTSAEAVSGGMIGGTFGVIMNSIFLASALKRTWNAPWGEKMSTFMEAAIGDFLGGYLMMLLSTRLGYKLLGLKNIDKSAAQIKGIKDLTAKIVTDKKNLSTIQRMLKSGVLDPKALTAMGINTSNISNVTDLAKEMAKKGLSVNSINTSIDKLAKMKAFQGKGLSFFKKLLYKPITMIGNLLSVGLESLPSKLADGKTVSAFKAGLMKFAEKFKGFAGFPMRFIFILLVLQPIFHKLCVKFSHKAFGKPTKSVYDYMYEDGKKKEEVTQQQPKIDMNNFADYTKLTGLAKQQAQGNVAQQISAQVAPMGISPSLVNQTLINRQKRLAEPVQSTQQAQISPNRISPATYVPSTTPPNFTNPELIAAVNRDLALSSGLEKHINNELDALKKGNAYDF